MSWQSRSHIEVKYMIRIKFTEHRLKEDKGDPRYICPACGNVGMTVDPSADGFESYYQMCRVCGFHKNDHYEDIEKKWAEAWKECGGEVLFDKTGEERSDYYFKVFYRFYGKYRYVLSDEEIETRNFDDRVFSQYGFLHKADPAKKITVKCEDGTLWKFDYETNKIFYLDDEEKFFAVGECDGRYYLFAGEGLTGHGPETTGAYRGGYIGFVPDLFRLYYPLDKECVLMGRDRKYYYFSIEKNPEDM